MKARTKAKAHLPVYVWEQLDGPHADLHFFTPQGYLVRYMEIGPDLATIMLDANKKNRSLSIKVSDMYGRDMARNDWPFIGSSIVFGDNGLLLDGQHRLLAIEDTESVIPVLVVGGLPPSAQKYIDAGRKRSAGDQLKIDGLANSNRLAGVATLMLSWAFWREYHKGCTIGTAEKVEYVQEHAGVLQDAVSIGLKVQKVAVGRVSYVAVGAAYARALQVTGDVFFVDRVFKPLYTGDNIRSGSPTSALMSNFRNNESADRLVDLWKLTRWWRAECFGEGIGKIQLPRGGVVVADMPDMAKPPEEQLSELDEQAADALENLRRGKKK